MSKQTKKDLAFDKERAKYRKEIRSIESLLRTKDEHIYNLKQTVNEKDEQIEIQKDWIERLLSYTEMNRDDLHRIIKKEKEMDEIINYIIGVGSIGILKKLGI